MNKRPMYVSLIVVGSLLIVWVLYSWLSVRGIEQPKYDVVSSVEGYEIREYASYIIAETTVGNAGDYDEAARRGFPIIAGYIFGDNQAKDKIAMTAPVNAEISKSEKIAMTAPVDTEPAEAEGAYKISFVMPAKYTLSTLPVPNNQRVELKEVPSRRVAVKRFTWSAKETMVKKYEEALLSALSRDGIKTVGNVNVARYNPPWTLPFMLRNEIQVEIETTHASQ